MSGTVLVTVGSTKFNELIKAVDSQNFADELVAHGYKKLIMQASPTVYLHVHDPDTACLVF